MPRVKKPRQKPIAYSGSPTPMCLYDSGFYEIYVNNVFMSKHPTQTEAEREARRLRKSQQSHSQVTINYKSICTYPANCKYWKSCADEKGTTFTQPWGKKMLMLLEMKRPQPEPKKDKKLDQFS